LLYKPKNTESINSINFTSLPNVDQALPRAVISHPTQLTYGVIQNYKYK